MPAFIALTHTIATTLQQADCFSLCRLFSIIGDGTGGLLLLNPVTLKPLLGIAPPGKKHFHRVWVSPDGALLACVTGDGILMVLQTPSLPHHSASTSAQPVVSGRVLCQVDDHCRSVISALAWRTHPNTDACVGLYVGDISGTVTQINVPKSKMAAMFQTTSVRLLRLNSSVCQLDYFDGELLVSTSCATYICSTRQELFTQVGDEQREGRFGGCLYRTKPAASFCTQVDGCSGAAGKQMQYDVTDVHDHFHSVHTEESYNDHIVSYFIGDEDNVIDVSSNEDVADDTNNTSTCTLSQSSSNYSNLSTVSTQACSISSFPAGSYEVSNIATKDIGQVNESPSSLPKSQSKPPLALHKTEPQLHCLTGQRNGRIWEANTTGEVIRTHNLASVLVAGSSMPVYDLSYDMLLEKDTATSASEAIKHVEQLADVTDNNSSTIDFVSNAECNHKISSLDNEYFSHCGAEQNIIESPYYSYNFDQNDMQEPKAFSFRQILRFQNKYILLISSCGIYCIDPHNNTLVFSHIIPNMEHIALCGNSLLYRKEAGAVVRVTLVPAEVAIMSLHSLGLRHSCAHLAARHIYLFTNSPVLARIKNTVIKDLLDVTKGTTLRNTFEKLQKESLLEKEILISTPFPSPNKIFSSGVTTFTKLKNGSLDLNYSLEKYKAPNLQNTNSPTNQISHQSIGPEQKMASSDRPSGIRYVRPFYGISTYGSMPAYAGETGSVLQDLVSSVASNVSSSKVGNVASNVSSSLLSSVSKLAAANKSNWRDYLPLNEQNKQVQLTTQLPPDSIKDVTVNDSAFDIKTINTDRKIDTTINSKNVILSNVKSVLIATVPSLAVALRDNLSTHTVEGCIIETCDLPNSSVQPMETFIVERNSRIKKKKKRSIGSRSNGCSPADTPKRREHKEIDTLATSNTVPAKCSPLLLSEIEILSNSLENFESLVSEIFRKLSTLKSHIAQVHLLNTWLPVYVNVLVALCQFRVELMDQDSDKSMPMIEKLCISRKLDSQHLKSNVSSLLTVCLTHRSSLCLPTLPANLILPSKFQCAPHYVTKNIDSKLDNYFATLFYYSQEIIDSEALINSLNSVGVGYYGRVWCVLTESVSANTSGDILKNHCIEIFENLEFNRSQKLICLRVYAENGEWLQFLDAACRLHHPSVIYDLLFFSRFLYRINTEAAEKFTLQKHSPVLPKKSIKESITELEFKISSNCLASSNLCYNDELLFTYLRSLSQKQNLASLYVKHWSCSRELQYEIVKCILCKYSSSFRKCNCGASLPAMIQNGACPLLLKLLRVVTEGILYDPQEVADLCLSHSYWRGYCNIVLRYELLDVGSIIPIALQTCSDYTVALLLQLICSYEQCNRLVEMLMAMSRGVSRFQLCCWQCRTIVDISPSLDTSQNIINYQSDYDYLNVTPSTVPTDDESDCRQDTDAGTASQVSPATLPRLWDQVMRCIVQRVGGVASLRLLQEHVDDSVAPLTIPSSVHEACLVNAATDHQTSALLHNALGTACNLPILTIQEEQHIRGLVFSSAATGSINGSRVSHLRDDTSRGSVSSKLIAALPSQAGGTNLPGSVREHSSLTTDVETVDYSTVNIEGCSTRKTLYYAEDKTLSTPSAHMMSMYGVRVSLLSLCGVCSVPLTAPGMVKGSAGCSGISVLRCGHAYHAICLNTTATRPCIARCV